MKRLLLSFKKEFFTSWQGIAIFVFIAVICGLSIQDLINHWGSYEIYTEDFFTSITGIILSISLLLTSLISKYKKEIKEWIIAIWSILVPLGCLVFLFFKFPGAAMLLAASIVWIAVIIMKKE